MSTFDFKGESFTYAEEFPEFAYAEFCEALDDGVDSSATHATAVALRLALASVADADQTRFRQACRKSKAKTADYLEVFHLFMEVFAERPTSQPTDSSDGPSETPVKSETQPVAVVTSLPEPEKPAPRADLALAISRSA